MGSFFVVGGQLKDGDNLLYAEGYATAASISEAINQPVIMTVNAGNMVEVAGRLKDAFQTALITSLLTMTFIKTRTLD